MLFKINKEVIMANTQQRSILYISSYDTFVTMEMIQIAGTLHVPNNNSAAVIKYLLNNDSAVNYIQLSIIIQLKKITFVGKSMAVCT